MSGLSIMFKVKDKVVLNYGTGFDQRPVRGIITDINNYFGTTYTIKWYSDDISRAGYDSKSIRKQLECPNYLK